MSSRRGGGPDRLKANGKIVITMPVNSNRVSPALLALAALLSMHLAQAQTVLITGANSGLGLEFAKQYAAAGWDVIATHRRAGVPATLAELQAEFDNVSVETIDVTSEADAKALAQRLRGVPIDVLINNAGVYNDRSGCRTEDCPGDWSTQQFGNLRFLLLDTIFAVNVKGPLLVSEALLENVRASEQKKIVAISSSNGSLTGPEYSSGLIFYRASKAALNRAMQLVALDQRAAGVTVLMLNPGPVLTERQEYMREEFSGVMLEMADSVSGMIEQIAAATLADSGRFIQYDGQTVPW